MSQIWCKVVFCTKQVAIYSTCSCTVAWWINWQVLDMLHHWPVRTADLERSTIRSNALSVSTQVLVALRYFATGSFQRVARDLHGVSQSSVSRCVIGVGKPLSCRASQYIMFPTNEASQRSVKFEFFDVAGLPNVPGWVDSTQIAITAPVCMYAPSCWTSSS